MPRYFAFLRAINVGGRNVTMEELRRHFTGFGLSEVESFIASGNIIFCTRATAIPALERKITAGLHRALGYEVPTFLRTEVQLLSIAGYQPFPAHDIQAACSLSVGMLSQPLTPAARKSVLALSNPIDRFHVNGSEVYWLNQTGQAESTVTMTMMERCLNAKTTFRNVNTIARLVAKYSPSAS